MHFQGVYVSVNTRPDFVKEGQEQEAVLFPMYVSHEQETWS